MKLIDLLKQELPKRGGWPNGVNSLLQGGSGGIYRDGCISSSTLLFTIRELADDDRAIVTREQYGAWNGEGLPPVGTECERSFNGTQWFLTTIVAHVTPSSKEHQAAFCDNDGDYNGWGYAGAFRPIRSARDKAIDALSLVILESHADDDEDMNTETYIYDTIAAGKIPGIKLED